MKRTRDRKRDAKGGNPSRRPRNRPRRDLVAGGVMLAVLLAAFASYFLLAPSGTKSAITGAGAVPADRVAAQSSPATKVQSLPQVALGAAAPEITFTTLDGVERRLSDFRGGPVMLWFFASWCPTCLVGTQAVARNFAKIRAGGLQIVQLRLYQNLGFAGPSTESIATGYSRPAYPSPQWLWGQATRTVSFTYDPRGYPDIYYLIDGDGIIRSADTAPHVTMDKILAFARGAP